MSDTPHSERRDADRDDLASERLVTVLRKIVHDEVKTRTSSWPKKNGDGLLGYIGRLVTPERIMLAIVLVYQLGGRVQQFTTNISTLEAKNQQLAAQIADVNANVERLGHAQQAAAGLAEKQDVAITDLKARAVALNQRLALTVTRGEFREAIEQRILPRLDRIEKQ
jgi:hypothetical protein